MSTKDKNNTSSIDDVKQEYKGNDNLHIYPIGESDVNTSDLLESEEFSAFIEHIKKEYDYVVINSTQIETDSFQILNKLAKLEENGVKSLNIKESVRSEELTIEDFISISDYITNTK